MLHRIRETWASERDALFSVPVEDDETYMGGRRKNMPKAKRQAPKGRGVVGKAAVVGAKNRTTKLVSARVVEHTDAPTLQGFARERPSPGAFHDTSAEHLQRYVNEFAGWHNVREADTIVQMESEAVGLVDNRLMYRDLIA